MLWMHENIEARIWSNDHCPPHVTFVCRPEKWTARIEFSMVTPHVGLKDIKPLKNAPSLVLINALANQVFSGLIECRRVWWETFSSVCLDNKRVHLISDGQVMMGSSAEKSGFNGFIISKSGVYRSNIVLATVRWNNGSTSIHEIEG